MKHNPGSIAMAFAVSCILSATNVSAAGSKPLPYYVYNSGVNGEATFNLRLSKIHNSQSIHLVLQKAEGKRLVVSLIGPDGVTLGSFSTHKKSGIIEVNYNFDGAADGTYTLQASDGKEKIAKKIIISRSKPEVVTEMHIE